MKKLLSKNLLSVCLAAAAVSTAIAQTTPNPGSTAAPASAKKHMDRPSSRPTERIEARLAYVKTALKITDAQQPLWKAYADFTRKNAQEMEQRFKSMRHEHEPAHHEHQHEQGHHKHPRSNAIERLEKAQSFHAEAITRINRLLAVQKPLYAALSPEQQKVADEVLGQRRQSMMGPSMRGHGGHDRS